jgi:S1-C subfamily serine protease
VPGLGTEVLTLRSHGPAATAGLAPGDLILTIEGRQTPDIGAVAALYRAAAPGSALLMTIQRRGRHHVLALEKR